MIFLSNLVKFSVSSKVTPGNDSMKIHRWKHKEQLLKSMSFWVRIKKNYGKYLFIKDLLMFLGYKMSSYIYVGVNQLF